MTEILENIILHDDPNDDRAMTIPQCFLRKQPS